MINRDKNADKEQLKKWFQIAKMNKQVYVIYKADNALKNNEGYKEGGLVRFINFFKRNDGEIKYHLENFEKRFCKNSLKETTIINYLGERIR